MLDVHVLDDPATAAGALEPTRAAILAQLREPGSASSVATALGLPRQRVNHHVRALEDLGLVQFVDTQPRRGLTARRLVASGRSYVVSPAALGPSAVDPARTDRLSAAYLIAVAARIVREVAELTRRADRRAQTLPTLTLDTDVRFASPADRSAFTAELTAAVTTLVARYHDESAPAGRWHRLVVAAHPRPAPTTEEASP